MMKLKRYFFKKGSFRFSYFIQNEFKSKQINLNDSTSDSLRIHMKEKINSPVYKSDHSNELTNSKDKSVNWEKLLNIGNNFEYKIKMIPNKPSNYKTFIFDINNVLLGFDLNKIAGVRKDLEKILKNSFWLQYLEGAILKSEAFSKISISTNYSVNFIENLINLTRASLIPIEENIIFLKELKKQGKELICLTNCPKDEMAMIRRKFDFFNNFDIIFCSGDIGAIKPSYSVFELVLNYCNLIPEETVFIDDDPSNIASAASFGITSICYKDNKSLDGLKKAIYKKSSIKFNEIRYQNLVSPYSKNLNLAFNYLTKYADFDELGLYQSIVGSGEKREEYKKSPSELFATAVILLSSKQIALSPVGDRILSLMKTIQVNGKFKFFNQIDEIPYDADTTSISLSLLYKHKLIDEVTMNSNIDDIFANHNDDNVILTYFNKHRYRICPVVCANILNLVHLLKRENDPVVESTKKFILNFLTSKAYKKGSTYYPNPNMFLYSVAKLVYFYPKIFDEFKSPLISELTNGLGFTDDPTSLAMRVICCNIMNIPNEKDFNKLISLQLEDGSWHESTIYSTSKKKSEGGYLWANRAYSTLFGMKAIEVRLFGCKFSI